MFLVIFINPLDILLRTIKDSDLDAFEQMLPSPELNSKPPITKVEPIKQCVVEEGFRYFVDAKSK